jgi:hypothetical protein
MYGVMLWFISLILAGILFTYTWKEPTGRYKYQATISDNVSFNEVYDKYYIKDLKGKIYTIEDKEK